MAYTINNTRRAFMAMAAATPAVLSADTAWSANDASILKLEAERSEVYGRLNSGESLSRSDNAALLDRAVWIEQRIAAAPCDSRIAAAVKLRTLVMSAFEIGEMSSIDYPALTASIVAFLD